MEEVNEKNVENASERMVRKGRLMFVKRRRRRVGGKCLGNDLEDFNSDVVLENLLLLFCGFCFFWVGYDFVFANFVLL